MRMDPAPAVAVSSEAALGPAYLDGEFLPLAEARVSVLDRGFLFGDGVYEVLPFEQRRVLFGAEHIRRLERSLAALEIQRPLPAKDWEPILKRLARDAPWPGGALYLQVTRGAGPRLHLWPEQMRPTVLVMCLETPQRDLQRGLAVISCGDIRWDWCHIKAVTLLPNVLLRRRAARAGADEVILTRAGKVVEASSANVFMVRDGRVLTPPHSEHMLPGITRDLLLRELDQAGLPCAEQPITLRELRAAHEIWLTGSTLGVAPVRLLDGQPLVPPETPLLPRAQALYQELKQRPGAAWTADA